MVLGKLDSYMYKNEIKTLPNIIHKDKLNDFFKAPKVAFPGILWHQNR